MNRIETHWLAGVDDGAVGREVPDCVGHGVACVVVGGAMIGYAGVYWGGHLQILSSLIPKGMQNARHLTHRHGARDSVCQARWQAGLDSLSQLRH